MVGGDSVGFTAVLVAIVTGVYCNEGWSKEGKNADRQCTHGWLQVISAGPPASLHAITFDLAVISCTLICVSGLGNGQPFLAQGPEVEYQ